MIDAKFGATSSYMEGVKKNSKLWLILKSMAMKTGVQSLPKWVLEDVRNGYELMWTNYLKLSTKLR
ncbi:hypothetical protein CR513_45016, partial [Mucuna pruriens]